MAATGATARLLTPSKVTAWLDCAHFLTLQHEVESGTRERPSGAMGELARLLMAKGLEHEQECLAAYEIDPGDVYSVPPWDRTAETFAAFVERSAGVLAFGHKVVFQMPFVHDGMRGIADFLLRVDLPDDKFTYEPVDAKLARKEAKPGHVLQLCFYAEAIEAQLGVGPERVHVWLGSGRVESIRLADVCAYWRRLRKQLAAALEPVGDALATTPIKCNYCTYCDFADVCTAHWREADALQFVAGIRSAEASRLTEAGVATLTGLSGRAEPVADLRPERLSRLNTQAKLQVSARGLAEDEPPPYRLIDDATDDERASGLAALPAPDNGDVFLDYEGHPFWRADAGLFFLFGLLTRTNDGEWTFDDRWAHDKADEAAQTKALIEYFAERRTVHPGMHVYHYNHTERSGLQALAAEHGADQSLLQQLVESGLFVDLLPIVRNGLQAGVESYGLKSMELLTGYQRSHDIDKGASAVVEYDKYMKAPADGTEILSRIAAYNEDDVRATRALRDWLVERRDPELEWREAFIEADDSTNPVIDAQIAELLAFAPDSPERLMGNVLGYWLREGRANTAQLLARASKDPDELLTDPDALAGLTFVGMADQFGKTGKKLKWPAATFHFPPQAVGHGLDPEGNPRGVSVCFKADDAAPGWLKVIAISPDDGFIEFEWKQQHDDLGVHPTAVVVNGWVSPRPKPEALSVLAADLLAHAAGTSVTNALLRRNPPAFTTGGGPAGGLFTDDLADIAQWVVQLEHSYVPIQGPPGTGKTFTGAHIVHALVKAEKRVGITAMSHAAIDNLLTEVVDVFETAGDLELLMVARRGTTSSAPDIPQITLVKDNAKCAEPAFNVVAGTTWLFAGEDMSDAKVDVLIVDEAGQLGLADALAATRSAHNVVLLGDPLQLPQVSQASHPEGSGASVLEHVLGPGVATIPPDRGVFLTETRRMHPDVCRFISDQIYEGRLGSHSSCATQGTDQGTGLRWLQAHHEGCSTESMVEAELVAEKVASMIGSSWTDARGKTAKLTGQDFMVVAPYNDQVRLLRAKFDADPLLAGVKVGTVDKFQGQQAPVVFFTMTTSTAADMPRDSQFLFSRNRLNVALSRARCLAFVVCTDELLNSRARDIDEMILIATLCAAVDYAEARA
ncbi:MAG TPA: TM0106 family RecB-like putative nuclease [Ilumatobacteraceae bacterium]|nr:TM0106 family RecB-like putative nuclease [Ilumatobacteraceae bacterium]